MTETWKNDLFLMGSLLTAIEKDQLLLHYQPKIDLREKTVTGFEALIRWQKPELGNIAPGQFIPKAENTDLIDPLTYWVADRALRTLASWRTKGIETHMAINVSSHNLLSEDFAENILAMIDKYQLNGSDLELEITETAIMADPKVSIEVLGALSDVNISIAIDDFGTGYSSLSYLHRLPATKIKIPNWFTWKLNKDRGVREIVAGAIDMLHRLDLKVIAEGIEKKDQLKSLLDLGCDYGQGYLIARPMPESDVLEWHQDYSGEA